ncbi:hypothetical protein [Staphylococcus xylosus]|nr:hypothetical protein [Staphylococcus xylosus]
MWIAIAFILAIIAFIPLIINSIKDNEIKKLQRKLVYVGGTIESNRRYQQ